jgi:DNA-directed RNA polymerase specialized sigma subunit
MNALNLNSETMQNLDRSPRFNLFTVKDHSIVREGVAALQGYEHSVVLLRFWESNTISEIAEILDLSWQDVEKYLSQAIVKLKKFCEAKQDFSRASAHGDQSCLNPKLPHNPLNLRIKAA